MSWLTPTVGALRPDGSKLPGGKAVVNYPHSKASGIRRRPSALIGG